MTSDEESLDDFKFSEREGRIFVFKSNKSENKISVRCFSQEEIEEYQDIAREIVLESHDDEARTQGKRIFGNCIRMS